MNTNRLDVQPTSYGQRILLPDRDVGQATVFGWVAIAFGTIGTLFMLAWIGGPAAFGIGMVLQGEWFGYLVLGFGMLGLGGLFMSVKLLAAGIAILKNRFGCEVRITDTEVISREKFGWFSHNVKVDREKIETLYLRSLLIVEDDDSTAPAQVAWITKRLPDNWHAIATQQKKGSLIAAGYPPEILLPLANVLKSELDRNRVGLVSIVQNDDDSNITSTVQQPISIVQQTAEAVEAVPLELPADSTIEAVDQGDTKVYRIPEKGVWKGSHGLMIFAVIWNTFLAFITFAMLTGAGNAVDDRWITIATLSIFWAAGVGLGVAAFYLGRQSALIGVRDGLLFIERKTIFGNKWLEFEPGKIASVHVGTSNMEVNDRPVMELKVQPVGEAATGMFSQLTAGELRWLAQQLTNELDLRPDSRESWQRFFDPSQPLVAPDNSKVIVERTNDQTVIMVPKQNMEGHWTLLTMGITLAVGALPTAILCIWRFDADWIVIPIALIATLTGVAMVVSDLLYSTRSFRVAASQGKLSIQRHGFLSDREYQIGKSDVKSVVLKDSGTKVNNRTYLHLAVVPRDSAQGFTMMSGRDEREIAYVAALIDQQLGLKANRPVG